MKALIIVNPVAGKKKIRKDLFSLITALSGAGYDSSVMLTRTRGEATGFAEKYSSEHDLTVCCGGDGTLNEVITGLMNANCDTRLMYYPCGSTNDFATTLGIPKKIDADCLCPEKHKILDLDIGEINGTYFSYIASYGVFTKSSYSASQEMKNVFGHAAYLLEGAKELPGLSKSYHTKVIYDDGEIEGDYVLVAATNSTSAGGILRLSDEQVKLNDGLIEVLLIKALSSIADTSAVINQLLKQQYDGKNVILLQTRKCVIECPDNPAWTVDGEFAGNIGRAEISCIHGAIHLLV